MSEKIPQKRKAGSSKIRITIINLILFVAVAAVFVWAIRSYYHMDEANYTNDAQVDAFISPINTRVGGYIKEIRFREHQPVKKGDTLLIIDDAELQTQLAQAEAAYMTAVASRGVTSSSINTVGNNVNVVDANIAAAKARLSNAEVNFKRFQRLLADESVTQQQYEQVKTEYDAQSAQFQALLNQRKTSSLSTVEVGKRLDMNAAEIKRAKAALDMAKLNVSYTVITAPSDGVTGRRVLNEGQLIQPGQPVASLVRNGSKWVTANFLEKQLDKLKVGQQLAIKVDALDGKSYEGVVAAISEATGSRYSAIPVDNSTGNFVKVQQRVPVRIEFSGATTPADLEMLRVGMNVEVSLK